MTEAKPITIVLIDDQAIVRAAFRSLIERNVRFKVVGDAGDARKGIDLVAALQPDVVILDITMPGLSGIDAVGPVKKASPHTKVLMASQHEGQKFVQQALQAGADGYLSKDSDPTELGLAIDAIQRGDSFLSPKVAGGIMARAVRGDSMPMSESCALDELTKREREVFQLLALGKANKEVAAMLSLSVGTVKKHRENLQRKLDCHSPADIARLAIREGLLGAYRGSCSAPSDAASRRESARASRRLNWRSDSRSPHGSVLAGWSATRFAGTGFRRLAATCAAVPWIVACEGPLRSLLAHAGA